MSRNSHLQHFNTFNQYIDNNHITFLNNIQLQMLLMLQNVNRQFATPP